MRQIVRRVIDRKGKVVVLELPEPHLGADQVLVQSHHTLISSGTEMTTLAKTPAELVRQTIADPWMRKAVQQTVLSAGLAQTARRVWHWAREVEVGICSFAAAENTMEQIFFEAVGEVTRADS